MNAPSMFSGVKAVLFDLDGTLADTAPDLAGAANAMRLARGLLALPLSELRPVASHGARGLLQVALDAAPSDANYEELRTEFLDLYEGRLCVESKLFEGMPEVLAELAALHLAWGIVTNKISRFTDPIVAALRLVPPPDTVVSGDTTPFIKPHPAPLLYAAAKLSLDPRTCVYVGDDARDIAAGRTSGMKTVAAAYGYCGNSDPKTWGADFLIASPLELLNLIE